MNDRPVKPPLQDRSRETLARILAATRTLLAERHFDDLSVDEIAREAGFTKGAFYSRFRSKEDLLLLLSLEAYEDALDEWGVFLDPGRWRDGTARAFLIALVQRVVRAYAERRDFMRTFAFEARWGEGEEVRRRARELNAAVEDGVVAVLGEHLRELRTERLRIAVRTALAALRGVLTEEVLFDDVRTGPPLDREELVYELGALLAAYLLVDPPG